jgi:enoyl-CoA hydratase/3-hydroxyacyl-CoA dehydrogenase
MNDKMSDISNIKTISIIGAGLLGHGIAMCALMAGFEKVILNDINMGILNEAADNIKDYLTILSSEEQFKQVLDEFEVLKNDFSNRNISKTLKNPIHTGVLAEGVSVEVLMGRLVKEIDLATAVANADFIIEAASEDMEIKKEIFKKLVEFAPTNVVLATNSSSLSITKIAENSGSPERIIGMHFFSPHTRSLIEITRGDKSSSESIEVGAQIGHKLPCLTGKRVIIKLEKESPGFIANRITSASGIYISWIMDRAAGEGIPWACLDADVGIASFGFCKMIDYIGLDVVYGVQKYLEEALSPDFAPSKVLTKLVENGNLGRKTGKGFYEWNEDGTFKNEDNIDPDPAGLVNLEALQAIQFNEGCRILEEGVVKSYRIIDKAMMKGYNSFGPFTARNKYEELCKVLEDLAEETGIKYFKPCKLMKSGDFLNYR